MWPPRMLPQGLHMLDPGDEWAGRAHGPGRDGLVDQGGCSRPSDLAISLVLTRSPSVGGAPAGVSGGQAAVWVAEAKAIL